MIVDCGDDEEGKQEFERLDEEMGTLSRRKEYRGTTLWQEKMQKRDHLLRAIEAKEQAKLEKERLEREEIEEEKRRKEERKRIKEELVEEKKNGGDGGEGGDEEEDEEEGGFRVQVSDSDEDSEEDSDEDSDEHNDDNDEDHDDSDDAFASDDEK